jgi:hypothetical protein
MNQTSMYQQSREKGISDQDLIKHFTQKDPEFVKKYQKATELGATPEQIFTRAHESYKKQESTQPQIKKEPSKEFEVADYVKDFAKQLAQGGGIGALGTYGDIADLLGVQAKEILPGEKAKTQREFDVLGKMEKGEKTTYSDIEELSENDVIPRYSRLPSSQQVEELGKKGGLVTEPETIAGRYGKRIGKLGGSGVALGAGGLAAPIVAGAAGQTLEEAGAPPWAQAAAEILATLKYSSKTANNITSKSPQVEETIKNLRKAGYSEQDITLAKNALEKRKILKKYATLTPEAENVINKGVKNSEELFNNQIKKGLPGYAEGGIPYLKKQADNVYQTMEEVASTIPIKNSEPVRKSIKESIDYLEKYPLLQEQKEFIEFLKDGLTKSSKANNAEFFTGFYRNLGKAGNWGNPKQKEHILGIVKDGIKKTFSESGQEAKKFGEYFDKTNSAWKRWIDAKDLMTTIEKAGTADGVNFKKLTSILNDKENFELAKKVLGVEQVKNINSIADGAQSIQSMLKQIPKNSADFQAMKKVSALGSLFTGDLRPIAAMIGWEAARKMSTDILINPDKQNRVKKLINAAKNNSPQAASIIAKDLLEIQEPK